jgi:hypothetical protein
VLCDNKIEGASLRGIEPLTTTIRSWGNQLANKLREKMLVKLRENKIK